MTLSFVWCYAMPWESQRWTSSAAFAQLRLVILSDCHAMPREETRHFKCFLLFYWQLLMGYYCTTASLENFPHIFNFFPQLRSTDISYLFYLTILVLLIPDMAHFIASNCSVGDFIVCLQCEHKSGSTHLQSAIIIRREVEEDTTLNYCVIQL